MAVCGRVLGDYCVCCYLEGSIEGAGVGEGAIGARVVGAATMADVTSFLKGPVRAPSIFLLKVHDDLIYVYTCSSSPVIGFDDRNASPASNRPPSSFSPSSPPSSAVPHRDRT